MTVWIGLCQWDNRAQARTEVKSRRTESIPRYNTQYLLCLHCGKQLIYLASKILTWTTSYSVVTYMLKTFIYTHLYNCLHMWLTSNMPSSTRSAIKTQTLVSAARGVRSVSNDVIPTPTPNTHLPPSHWERIPPGNCVKMYPMKNEDRSQPATKE